MGAETERVGGAVGKPVLRLGLGGRARGGGPGVLRLECDFEFRQEPERGVGGAVGKGEFCDWNQAGLGRFRGFSVNKDKQFLFITFLRV